jgi:hypothetical protein
MPLRDVYIFDGRPERTTLSIAFEYSGNASDQALLQWQQENASDFTGLRAVLGLPMSLVLDDAHNTWRLIRDAARVPMFTVGRCGCFGCPDDLKGRATCQIPPAGREKSQ